MADTVKRSTKVPKRRNERNILTFYEKIAVIRYYDETDISRNSLAKMFHCCATQIRRVLEKKEELLHQLATLSEADASIIIEEMTRKRRKFEMCAISFILHQWVERCRQMRLRKSITNQTLKEVALKMSAILNLPSFRPSYRWLNRFRGKYKYNEEDLGLDSGADTVVGDLAVEDIIIEFKNSLPSFMQKEISAITSIVKVDDKVAVEDASVVMKCPDITIFDIGNSDDDGDDSEDRNEDMASSATGTPKNELESACQSPATVTTVTTDEQTSSDAITPGSTIKPTEDVGVAKLNGGTTALLDSVFPHLAVIHQFALMNADIKALELISQLGVHMQTQAICGVYKKLSLATTDNGTAQPVDTTDPTADAADPADPEAFSDISADIDDIELIE